MTIYVGRLPIFDRTTAVTGYRILASEPDPGVPGRSRPVPSVRIAAEHGLDRLVGQREAFLSVDTDDLGALDTLAADPGGVVVELLGDLSGARALGAAVAAVRERGFRVLLDDPDPDDLDRLLGAIAFVRVDARDVPDAAVTEVLEKCRSRGCRVVAAAVEDAKQFDRYVRLGFDVLEGGYLHRPPDASKGPAPDVTACARLAVRLNDPEIDPDEVEQLVQADAVLSYRVLRAANAAWIGRTQPVRSVREAVLVVGLRTIRSWVLTILLGAEAGRSQERVQRVLTRARACEFVADSTRLAEPGAAFTVGLLSGLHVALGTPLDRIVSEVAVDPELADALLHGDGALGEIVTAVDAYESGHDAPGSRIDTVTLQHAMLAALSYALETYTSVDDEPAAQVEPI